MKEEVAFFQAVKARLVKFDSDGSVVDSKKQIKYFVSGIEDFLNTQVCKLDKMKP